MMYDVSGRGVASIARATAMAVALCLGAALTPAIAADEPPAPSSAMTPTPPATFKGEFDNSCAMGLASGQMVKTDCSVNWTAPDGKVYCFSTEASKEAFLKNPDENIQKAKEFFLAQDLTKDNAAGPIASGQPPAAAAAKPTKDVHRGRRQQSGRRGGQGTLEGRRLRVPRSQARRRPRLDHGEHQGRARHGRLWLVRQCHLPRQGRAEEAIRHRLLVQAGRRSAHPHGHQGAEGTEAGGRWLDHDHAPAGGVVVAPGAGASRATWR